MSVPIIIVNFINTTQIKGGLMFLLGKVTNK